MDKLKTFNRNKLKEYEYSYITFTKEAPCLNFNNILPTFPSIFVEYETVAKWTISIKYL